jgi:hydroxymethylpyrimidine/phosphomethylpyrimidine kinase
MTDKAFDYEYPRVLSIAGSDSGGGAGIQADLKTFAALGCYGMTAITALTAQNTLRRPRHPWCAAADAARPDRCRDGRHRCRRREDRHAACARYRARPWQWRLTTTRCQNVVLDPVMVATSGAVLIDNPAIAVLVRELFPRALVVTPNLDEASLLVGRPLADRSRTCRRRPRNCSPKERVRCLLKGGHLPGDVVSDLLATQGGEPSLDARTAHSQRQYPRHWLHSVVGDCSAPGVGPIRCWRPFSSAHAYVRAAMEAGARVRTGAGSGPLNHGHAPIAMRLKPLR